MSASSIKRLLLTTLLGPILLSCSTQELANPALPEGRSVGSVDLPDPLAAGWNGQPVCVQLSSRPQQRVLKCTFPPGVGHERHFHAPHFGYALSGGRMQLTDASGTRQVDLATGSHYTSAGTQWHEVLNVGLTTVQYLIIETVQ